MILFLGCLIFTDREFEGWPSDFYIGILVALLSSIALCGLAWLFEALVSLTRGRILAIFSSQEIARLNTPGTYWANFVGSILFGLIFLLDGLGGLIALTVVFMI